MAYKLWSSGELLTSADVNAYLMKQTVIQCTSSTRPASPPDGMCIYETDTRFYRSYSSSSSSWVVTGSSLLLVARKPSNDQRNTNTVTPDPHLQIANLPGAQYYILRAIINYSGDSTADIKGGLYGPTNASFTGAYRGAPNTAASTNSTMTIDSTGFNNNFVWGNPGVGVPVAANIDGILYTGDGGTVGFQWAQSVTVGGVGTTVSANSYIELTPVG